MSWRRGGRNVFAPAALLWGPAMVGGLLLLGLGATTRNVGGDAWVVRVTMGQPANWFADGPSGAIGVALLAIGTILWVVAQARPASFEWPLLLHRYGPFATVSVLLLVAAVLASWHVEGHVVDIGAGGASWRFVATYRAATPDMATAATAAVLAVVFWILSWGRVPYVPRQASPEYGHDVA